MADEKSDSPIEPKQRARGVTISTSHLDAAPEDKDKAAPMAGKVSNAPYSPMLIKSVEDE
ncbi:hypothetical protein [Inquilinus sp.]|jgi:hypothetical protein|uniref:hypothetical protein n=1 Tax=Inquilinus sp. TaxID=1932117 RepID=UPI003784974E